ncbi:MAG: glycosyltransferase [Bacillota bacterium]|nr:glycosyltransferase [Bacillota bacterium]
MQVKKDEELFASGLFWLDRKDYEVALDALVECHLRGYRKQEIEKIILEDYYIPYKNQLEKNYFKNVDLLRNYPYIYSQDYPDFNDLCYQFIPCSASRFIIYDRKKSAFISDFDLKSELNLDQCKANSLIMIKNEFRLGNILDCLEKTRDPNPFLWMKIPQYLFYSDFNEFVQYLQIFDFSTALESERLVFLFGREELKQYFSDSQALLPEWILNIWDEKKDYIVDYINNHYPWTEKCMNSLRETTYSYYASVSRHDLRESIQSGKPRILFVTSRFTTALQYFIRDCACACDRLCIPNQVLIETSNLHRISLCTWFKTLNDFKPDIIFAIDHFRWESAFLPANIVFISWVQDVLPHIASHESGARIGSLDFVLNAFVTNIDFLLDYSYPREAIIEAPVVANQHIYKSYSLNQEEKDLYSVDICAFSNAGNPQKGLHNFLNLISFSPRYDELKLVFKIAYREMYKSFYQEKIFYSLEDYRRFLFEHLKAYGLSIPEENLSTLAREWRQQVGYRILRSVPLEWLHEKGYDMKIWGSEWTDHALLADYAQGVAENGETLSRIINACKIVIGTNPGMTTHPRVCESILSNTFYLAYRIPEENDWANIRRYLMEDKEIVFAYSREDLYNKVDYYLENEEERRRIISSARKKITENLTYEVLISRVIKEIALKLEERL